MSIPDRLAAALADRYRLERELGQGGMAVVFLAADLKHDRRVAIKVLKPELAAMLGAERFIQEIKTTAALQHPHILPLFDSGEADGYLFYVMPFVEGETLRDKLNRESQFGVDEALRIACDIADALDYAHRRSVIHRDIKPENILLHDGRPMVADFGIALALSAAAGGRLTETGLSLGTPHYMSPEQATADKEISGRSDVYSLASVLYEMLTGDPPHTGKTAQQIIMKIIAEPVKPVTDLRKSVSPQVAAAIAKALEKLPADRFATAAEFGLALTGQMVLHSTAVPASATTTGGGTPWKSIALLAMACSVLLAGVAAWKSTSEFTPQLFRMNVALPEQERLVPVSTRRFQISADGRRLVYIGPDSNGTQLWLRELHELTARPLPGTHNATAPFFSPDGQTVGFFAEVGSALAIVPITGGQPRIMVSDSLMPWGADWGEDDNIYALHRGGHIVRIPARGGRLERVTSLDSTLQEFEHDWPQLLPGGKKILVMAWKSTINNSDLAVIDIASGERTVVATGAYGRYLRSGHMLFATFDGELRVARFDPQHPKAITDVQVIEQRLEFDVNSGVAQFAASDNGVLVYSPGGGSLGDQPVWVDRQGNVTPVDSSWRGQFSSVSLSPDGSRVAVSQLGSDGSQIWVKQLPRGPITRLTFDAPAYREAWLPNGRELAFVRVGAPKNTIWMQRADGSAPPRLVLEFARSIDEVEVTRDGRSLLFRAGTGTDGSRDIYILGLESGALPQPFAASPKFDEYAVSISPDGVWVAYVSVESGRPEVYVRSLRDPQASRTQVSNGGGQEPLWAHSGREIFYRTNRGDVVSAQRALGAEFQIAKRQVLFTNPGLISELYHRHYDIERGDQRFLMSQRAMGARSELVLVSDWRRSHR